MLLTIHSALLYVIKKCEIQSTLINLHPNEYSREFQ